MNAGYANLMKKTAADFMQLVSCDRSAVPDLNIDLLSAVTPWLTTEELVRIYRWVRSDEKKLREVEGVLAKAFGSHLDGFDIHPKKR